MTTPPVCDYEGSDYQSTFWDQGGRQYEDRAEAIALKRLLPQRGKLLLELGAGAGRNTPRYVGFDRVVLLDYSRTQLEQAQERLVKSANQQIGKSANQQIGKSANQQIGNKERYIFVAADAYRLPFVDHRFDAATMIRALHHMAEAPRVLKQVGNALEPGGVFILEFANKRNLKAILRYLLGRQTWSPFTREPVEFARLNFDFHPAAVRGWLKDLGFDLERTLTVSHFRMGFLKRLIPAGVLVWLDSLFQWTGAIFQLTPSVFVRARKGSGAGRPAPPDHGDDIVSIFKCPECGHSPLTANTDHLACPGCRRNWALKDGIYDFREPVR